VTKKIRVSNLPTETTGIEVQEMFSRFGPVKVDGINDRDSVGPGGSVVVEMDDAAAEMAVAAVDGTDVNGQAVSVRLA
jgi:RNA recognition motif-containing protein